MMENERKVNCMEKGLLSGVTESLMLESMFMGLNKAMESFAGLMGKDMKGFGLMANKKAKELFLTKERKKLECGKKESLLRELKKLIKKIKVDNY